MRRKNLYHSTNTGRLSEIYDDLQLDPYTERLGQMEISRIKWDQYYPCHWIYKHGCDAGYEYEPRVSTLYLSHHPEEQHRVCESPCPPQHDHWDAWDNVFEH